MCWVIFWRCFLRSLTWQKSHGTILPGAPAHLFAFRSVKGWTSPSDIWKSLKSWTCLKASVFIINGIVALVWVWGLFVACFWSERIAVLYDASMLVIVLQTKGELMLSPHMEELQSALFYDAVPDTWTKLAPICKQPCPLVSTLIYLPTTNCLASTQLFQGSAVRFIFCLTLVLMESALLWSEFCRSAKHFAKARLCHLLLSLVEGLFSILQNSFSPCQQQYSLEGRMTWRKIGSVFTLFLEIPLTSLSKCVLSVRTSCSWFVFVLAYLGVLSAPLKMVPDNLHLRSYQLLSPVSSSFWACANMTNGDAQVSPWDKHYTTWAHSHLLWSATSLMLITFYNWFQTWRQQGNS